MRWHQIMCNNARNVLRTGHGLLTLTIDLLLWTVTVHSYAAMCPTRSPGGYLCIILCDVSTNVFQDVKLVGSSSVNTSVGVRPDFFEWFSVTLISRFISVSGRAWFGVPWALLKIDKDYACHAPLGLVTLRTRFVPPTCLITNPMFLFDPYILHIDVHVYNTHNIWQTIKFSMYVRQ